MTFYHIPVLVSVAVAVLLFQLRIIGRAVVAMYAIFALQNASVGRPAVPSLLNRPLGRGYEHAGSLAYLDCRLTVVAVWLVGTETAHEHRKADKF